MSDCTGILAARNRTKKRCNVFYYEALGNIASEFAFGCMAMAMTAMKCKMDFLKMRDRLILKKVRSVIENRHKAMCV
jgi:hypothetical protein